MPYTRIWIDDDERDTLMKLAQIEEGEQARDEQRKPRRITVSDAARGCFVEGLEDMKVRQPIAEEDEDE